VKNRFDFSFDGAGAPEASGLSAWQAVRKEEIEKLARARMAIEHRVRLMFSSGLVLERRLLLGAESLCVEV
jgi:hypothetical protein